ncbi:MAG: peptidylprolyl isomerase [bacterium]
MEKKFGLFVAIVLIAVAFMLCSVEEPVFDISNENEITEKYSTVSTEETNLIKMVVNGEGTIIIELYEDEAPITVENFKKLVSNNYYDDVEFHRIIDGFMVQGGNGETTDSIVGEFASNGYTNEINHIEGTVSMARTSDMDSASGQFFICLTNTSCSHLDGDYAAFGKVIEGMDVVEKIASVETDDADYPLETIKISTVEFLEVIE